MDLEHASQTIYKYCTYVHTFFQLLHTLPSRSPQKQCSPRLFVWPRKRPSVPSPWRQCPGVYSGLCILLEVILDICVLIILSRLQIFSAHSTYWWTGTPHGRIKADGLSRANKGFQTPFQLSSNCRH